LTDDQPQPPARSENPPSRKSLPPFEALRTFDAVARLGGVRRAAKWLDRDHAVISRHLRAIETWAGVQLVERTPYGIALTELGRGYHERVSFAMDMLAHATLDLMSEGHHRRLHIWSTSGFALHWLSSRLEEFERRNSDADIVLRPNYHSPDFAAHEADIDVRFHATYEPEPELPPLLKRQVLVEAPIIAVASPDYLGSTGTPQTPDDLLQHRLLHEDSFKTWAKWLASYGVDDASRLSGARLWEGHLTLDAARHGRGIALANPVTAGADLESGSLIDIGRDNPDFAPRLGRYTLYARRDRWNDPLLRRFRKWATSAVLADYPALKSAT
jgi:DNA-binding transcriptional LysR family regulator